MVQAGYHTMRTTDCSIETGQPLWINEGDGLRISPLLFFGLQVGYHVRNVLVLYLFFCQPNYGMIPMILLLCKGLWHGSIICYKITDSLGQAQISLQAFTNWKSHLTNCTKQRNTVTLLQRYCWKQSLLPDLSSNIITTLYSRLTGKRQSKDGEILE